MRFGTSTVLTVLSSVCGCFCIDSSKGHLENTPLAGLGCRLCLRSLLDETACNHTASRKKSLGSSPLPTTSVAFLDSPCSAQGMLVAPLPPKTASSIDVHCKVGGGQVTACPQCSCVFRS